MTGLRTEKVDGSLLREWEVPVGGVGVGAGGDFRQELAQQILRQKILFLRP